MGFHLGAGVDSVLAGLSWKSLGLLDTYLERFLWCGFGFVVRLEYGTCEGLVP